MNRSLFFVLLALQLHAFSQKPPIDTSAFRKWVSAGTGLISDDGRYVCYTVNGGFPERNELVVQSVKGNWILRIENGSMASFIRNGKQLVFEKGEDSLCVLSSGKSDISFVAHVSAFNLPDSTDGAWMAYRSMNSGRDLVLLNLDSGNETVISNAKDFLFSGNGGSLLFDDTSTKERTGISSLKLLCFRNRQLKTIWSGMSRKVINYTFDRSGERVAFIVGGDKDGESEYALWYYAPGMDTAVLLADDTSPGIENGLRLASPKPEFSKTGGNVYFSLQSTEKPKPREVGRQVDIWSYADRQLRSGQVGELNGPQIYRSVITIGKNKVVRLEGDEERIVGYADDWVLVLHDLGYRAIFESGWNPRVRLSYDLVSVRDGARRRLRKDIMSNEGQVVLSPGGKFAVYYDFDKHDFFSYEIATGLIRNITKKCQTDWMKARLDFSAPRLSWVPGLKTWFTGDEAVLIYDGYDIWQIDPLGKKPPLAITNGYGHQHHIKFELLDFDGNLSDVSAENHSTLLLKAVDMLNKNWGIYSIKSGKRADPEMRCMGPYIYGSWRGYDTYNYPQGKARSANVFLVTRMSAVEAPNYFVTTDFRNFGAISDVQPQKDYNWITTKLLHWKTLDGRISAGILYKPEDFDPKRKYPVIFDYYDKRSDELNLFIAPEAAKDRINIPWFVSNGYLVFTPDIMYGKAGPGQSAYNSVVSAARYLSTFSWVDANRMGIQGHSFGGYETNYLVSHTSIFAAACSASGFCDLISWYGSGARGGYPMYWAEEGQGRMNGTPWKNPDLYIRNSPVYSVDKVTTPLLMMQNKGDYVVPFWQGVEFFSDLRRLGKKVWLLNYENSGHSVIGKSAMDYNFRMSQFFDHYLKGKPEPGWMGGGD